MWVYVVVTIKCYIGWCNGIIPSRPYSLVNGFTEMPVFEIFRLLIKKLVRVLFAHRMPHLVLHNMIYGHCTCLISGSAFID